ncbi:MAG: hypothetical protein COT84_05420 [Chlamydiae bacterium CG10_big_fil_rev_8_21_14_0_10_35_9]|nr:MAG: hypothetical protein COT84_05420 [Chlamydiae bacterium CG10_big_fil_rev_8_21_14_0_10_35_9]
MLVKTIIFSVIVIVLCLVMLGIGLILTGKPKLKKGCGSLPKEKGKCDKNSCEVCGKRNNKRN